LKINYATQREILLGRSINDFYLVDFLEDVPHDVLHRLLASCTQVQRAQVNDFCRRVPCGVLPVLGAAGVGKTTFVAKLVVMQMAAGRPVEVFTASNVAATNIAKRIAACMCHPDEYVVVRPWSPHLEEDAVLRYAAHYALIDWQIQRSNPLRGHSNWVPELSTAQWVINLLQAIPTTNAKLLQMRAQHQYFIKVINQHPANRMPEDQERLRSYVRCLCKAVILNADAICGTTTSAMGDWVKHFLKIMKCVVIDEAGAAVVSEIMIPWKGDMKLIVAGDFRQLPPAVLSMHVTHENGAPVNPASNHQENSMLKRLVTIGWPHLVLKDQLRICPGGFDTASDIIYPTHGIVDGPFASTAKHPKALVVEKSFINNVAYLKPSPSGRIFPILVNVHNGVDVIPPGSTSKINIQNARVGMMYIFRLLSSVPTLKASDIAIIVPYLGQQRIYNEAIDQLSGRGGISLEDLIVVTADSFQGWERSIIFWDVVSGVHTGPGFMSDPRRICVHYQTHGFYGDCRG
jgi:AAA domain